MGIVARLLRGLLLYETVKHIERIEQEVGVDLLLELNVTEQGQVGLLRLSFRLFPGPYGIFRHPDDDDTTEYIVKQHLDHECARPLKSGHGKYQDETHHDYQDKGEQKPAQATPVTGPGTG